MVSDLEAAEVEVTEAIAAFDKTKAELGALEETMRIQQVCIHFRRYHTPKLMNRTTTKLPRTSSTRSELR